MLYGAFAVSFDHTTQVQVGKVKVGRIRKIDYDF